MSEKIETLHSLVEIVRVAGLKAQDGQRQLTAQDREFKDDGSVLTRIDEEVDDFLFKKISGFFPQVNVLTEETVRSYDETKPYTFAVDPIDGTDVFSQGMAGWSVSVGLLDRDLTPVAGIIFAPALNLLVMGDLNRTVTLNGRKITPPRIEEVTRKSNLMVSSRFHQKFDYAKYPGKIRSIGSGALHGIFPILYSGIVGSVGQRGAYVWDIAAAHAINTASGFVHEYLNGNEVDYQPMVRGSKAADGIISGAPHLVVELRTQLKRC